MTEEPQTSPRGSPPPTYAEEPPPQPSPIGTPPPRYPEEPEPQTTLGPSQKTRAQRSLPLPEMTPQSKYPIWDNSHVVPNSFLIVVDTYNWAWDIASKELLKAMPEFTGTIVDITNFGKVNPLHYNVVLVYPWGTTGLMERLYPQNTVVCMAGGEQLQLLLSFKEKCGRFKFYGACNEKIQAKLMQMFPTKKVLHLTHGVDNKLFTPGKTRHRKEFTIGWVGNSTRAIKRFDIAVDVAKQGEFKLLTAGFKRYTHDKMPRYYHSIDTLIVTSIYEAHPLVVYEAMASGLSVVTTNVGDVSRYIVHGENGFILPRNATPAEYINILNRLKSDEKLRMRIGKAARQTVIEELSWDKIVEQYTPLPELMGVL